MTLNAPEKRNAISTEMRTLLRDRLRALNTDASCGAIVLTGANGFFCAGADVSEMVSPADDPVGASARLHILHDVVRLMVGGRKPVVAAIEGAAAGAGLALAAACDVIVAARDARLVPSFLGVGLTADCGLQWTLGSRIGASATRRLLLAGRPIPAVDAQTKGLVDFVVEAGGAIEAATAEAQTLAQMAPLAVAAVKASFANPAQTLDDTLYRETDTQSRLAMSRDHAEAKAAFSDRRRPVFVGR